jgi:hypothetical protein
MSDHVFLCYSRMDKDFAIKLATSLKNQGIPVWLDLWDIPPGADWDQTIEKALKDCTSLLLVISPSSVESEEVRSEWRSVLDKEKVVVPILYQTCEIPYRLTSIQYIDYTSRSPEDKEALGQILKALELKKPLERSEKPPKPPVWPNYKNIKVNIGKVATGTSIVIAIFLILFFYGLWNPIQTQNPVDLSKYYGPVLNWSFSKDFDGWEKTGNISPWETWETEVKWYKSWGNSSGVIVMDACDQKLSGLNVSAGIIKSLFIPNYAKNLTVSMVKADHDGGFKVVIEDSSGTHLLGRGILYAGDKKQFSYDISQWAGQNVTLGVLAVGAGSEGIMDLQPNTSCEPTCCFEYIGVDSIDIRI